MVLQSQWSTNVHYVMGFIVTMEKIGTSNVTVHNKALKTFFLVIVEKNILSFLSNGNYCVIRQVTKLMNKSVC